MKFEKGGRRCARETKTESLAACGDGGRILETRRDAMCRRAEEMAGGIGRQGGRRRDGARAEG